MARGLHRFLDMDLRYVGKNNVSSFATYKYKRVTTSQTVVMPRGDFRFYVFGGGGGGAFYKSTGSTQNTTGVFSGSFGAACGGRGGIAVFDVHIPNQGVQAVCTVGTGGTGKTASSTTAAGTGGQSKVVISDLGITVTANGGVGGKAGGSKANCTPGAGGAVAATGVTLVARASQPACYIGSGTNDDRQVEGRHYVTKLDWNYGSATDLIDAYYQDNPDNGVSSVVRPTMINGTASLINSYGIGGNGMVAVENNMTTGKYIVSGYMLDGDWTFFGQTDDGRNGVVMITRL